LAWVGGWFWPVVAGVAGGSLLACGEELRFDGSLFGVGWWGISAWWLLAWPVGVSSPVARSWVVVVAG